MGSALSLLGNMGEYWQSYMGARAARETANYNARIAKQKAELLKQATARETSEANEQARKFKASQRAALTAAGADTTTGTPLLLMVEQAGDIQMDILNMRRNRAVQVQGLMQEAEQYRHAGKLAIRGAGGSAIAGGISSAADFYNKYKSTDSKQPSTFSTNTDNYAMNRGNTRYFENENETMFD